MVGGQCLLLCREGEWTLAYKFLRTVINKQMHTLLSYNLKFFSCMILIVYRPKAKLQVITNTLIIKFSNVKTKLENHIKNIRPRVKGTLYLGYTGPTYISLLLINYKYEFSKTLTVSMYRHRKCENKTNY